MSAVVCFGEVMLRLTPPGCTRFAQAKSFDVAFGGAENNVAVSLACFGEQSRMVTKMPENAIADMFMREMRAVGVDTRFVVRGGERETGISVSGRNEYWFAAETDIVRRGRAINRLDIQRKSRVCLIGQDVLDEFFYGVNPLGETIWLGGLEFTVVGLLDADFEDADVIIPYSTALKMNSESVVTRFTVYLDDAANSESAQTLLSAALDEMFSYEDDCYEITEMKALESTMDELLGMMSALLAGIASIALVVGGIGIMNMMLTSVTERTREIGLKKALGAQSWHIQLQFLLESFLLSMLGGLMGVALGLLLSLAMCDYMSIRFHLSYGAIALGTGFSAAVGILFGWAPARKASRLNPIDALRSM